jgi:hypothetical protein
MPSAGFRSHALATEELGPTPLARNAPLRQQAAVRTLTLAY